MEELYGHGEQERLDTDIEDTVRRVMEDEEYSDFPIKINVFKRMSIAKDAETLARDILDDILENLDQEHGDPDSNGTESTENMRKASLELAKVMLKDYQSWTCEKTGEVIEYSKKDAEKLCN